MPPYVAVSDAENIPERRFQVLMDGAWHSPNEEPPSNIVDKSKRY